MQCPACASTLSERVVEGVTFDVCAGGCAGVWFDWHELARVDEPDEAAGEELLEVPADPAVVVDHTARRACPRCGDTVTMRHFHSVKRAVEVDECPRCAGFWLDVGELRSIRAQFGTEEERREAAREYFADVFDDDFRREAATTQEHLERARRFAHALRFICPSYYIPGDQDWGAF